MTTKKQPLTPADVPPGSVIRHNIKSTHWSAVVCVNDEGIFDGHTNYLIGYSWLMECFEILRPTDKDWQPCYKEVKPTVRNIRPDELPEEFILKTATHKSFVCGTSETWIRYRAENKDTWSRSLDGPWHPFTVEE